MQEKAKRLSGSKSAKRKTVKQIKTKVIRRNVVKPQGITAELSGRLHKELKTKNKQEIHTSGNSIILSGFAYKPESRMTPMEKMELIEEGVSKNDLELLKEKTKMDYDQLAQALSAARATLINRKGEDHFSRELSEKIVGLADLYSYGYEIFKDPVRFNEWMFRANQALGGKMPFDLLHSSYGREEVKDIIGRIAYGVYS